MFAEIIIIMSLIEEWYKEIDPFYKKKDVFSKGFKIIRNTPDYIIKDIRFNDFYQDVSDRDMGILAEKGFIKGTSLILYFRDKHRMELLEHRIIALSEQKVAVQNTKDDGKNKKRLGILDKNIKGYVDLLLFYSHRIKQYEEKQ